MTEEKQPKPSVDQRGLAGQVIGETSVCAVNQTQLMYRGYEIADLAENASFEEVAHLLLVGHKPTPDELSNFKSELVQLRPIPSGVRDVIVQIAKESPEAHPMGVLRTAISLLSHHCPACEDNTPEADLIKSKHLLAQIPTCIGVHQMALDGKEPVDPKAELDHAANLLWCMTGETPEKLAEKVMDVSLILYAEHDFNASTFSCRVVSSTNSDMHSAVCGGVSALKGNLHGGANEAAMNMLQEIMSEVDKGSSVEQFMENAF